ncbi:MAG: 6,7-dimethyl-8-ribityllumazine synthase, partial [Syntrophomonadaceae bacterium]
MANLFEGKLIGDGQRFGVIVSRFNEFITNKLLSGCLDTLTRHGVDPNDIDIAWVPGAFEMPLAAQRMAQHQYDAVICLGAVIRGATPHFEYVSAEVTKGIA